MIIIIHEYNLYGVLIMWTKPTYENVRLGFEITMYFSNR